MRRIIVLAALVLALAADRAAATQPGVDAIKRWKLMDVCARQAQAAFPDFTAEASAKRDAKLKECLASGNLPPRAPQAPR